MYALGPFSRKRSHVLLRLLLELSIIYDNDVNVHVNNWLAAVTTTHPICLPAQSNDPSLPAHLGQVTCEMTNAVSKEHQLHPLCHTYHTNRTHLALSQNYINNYFISLFHGESAAAAIKKPHFI